MYNGDATNILGLINKIMCPVLMIYVSNITAKTLKKLFIALKYT